MTILNTDYVRVRTRQADTFDSISALFHQPWDERISTGVWGVNDTVPGRVVDVLLAGTCRSVVIVYGLDVIISPSLHPDTDTPSTTTTDTVLSAAGTGTGTGTGGSGSGAGAGGTGPGTCDESPAVSSGSGSRQIGYLRVVYSSLLEFWMTQAIAVFSKHPTHVGAQQPGGGGCTGSQTLCLAALAKRCHDDGPIAHGSSGQVAVTVNHEIGAPYADGDQRRVQPEMLTRTFGCSAGNSPGSSAKQLELDLRAICCSGVITVLLNQKLAVRTHADQCAIDKSHMHVAVERGLDPVAN